MVQWILLYTSHDKRFRRRGLNKSLFSFFNKSQKTFTPILFKFIPFFILTQIE